MHKERVFVGDYVRCRKGQVLEVREIDKSDYCTLVDAEGEIVKRHEPIDTLTTDFLTTVEGAKAKADAEAKAKAKAKAKTKPNSRRQV